MRDSLAPLEADTDCHSDKKQDEDSYANADEDDFGLVEAGICRVISDVIACKNMKGWWWRTRLARNEDQHVMEEHDERRYLLPTLA
jgi:hypothetical protein